MLARKPYMKITRLAVCTAIMSSVSATACAQRILEAGPSASQAVVQRDADGFVRCGVRLISIEKDSNGNRFVADMEVDINRTPPFATIGVTRYRIGRDDTTTPVTYQPDHIELADESSGKRILAQPLFQSGKGQYVGVIDLSASIPVVGAILMGQPYHYVFAQSANDDASRRAMVPMEESTMTPYYACSKKLLAYLAAQFEAKPK